MGFLQSLGRMLGHGSTVLKLAISLNQKPLHEHQNPIF